MSLGAMKQFKQATGKDLWCSLLLFLQAFEVNKKKSALTLCTELYRVMDFETAAHAFHALFCAAGDKVPLAEIEDAMFNVGWLPTTAEHDYSEPWPLMMVALASLCDSQLREQEIKKP